jgi:NitT/TauT family transport system permease protein
MNRFMRHLRQSALSISVFISLLVIWEIVVWVNHIPAYILPSPSLIYTTLIADSSVLMSALWVTLRITLSALIASIIGGVSLAIIFTQWRWIERAFFPIAVILQVTPIIAIAPLLLIYLEPQTAVLACAFLVSFFPILANTAFGLASTDRHLNDLLSLYGASRWQILLYLRLPTALPSFLAGVRIGGGLSLIGAIVAEIAAGSAGQGAGLAFRIVEAGFRLNIPRMFAALTLISFTGIFIYACLHFLSWLILHRWHESAHTQDL